MEEDEAADVDDELTVNHLEQYCKKLNDWCFRMLN